MWAPFHPDPLFFRFSHVTLHISRSPPGLALRLRPKTRVSQLKSLLASPSIHSVRFTIVVAVLSLGPRVRLQLCREHPVLCGCPLWHPLGVHPASVSSKLAVEQLVVGGDLKRRGTPGPTADLHCIAIFILQLAFQLDKGS